LSEAAMKRARNVYANEKNVNFIVDDILDSNCPDQMYRCIRCKDIHIVELRFAMREHVKNTKLFIVNFDPELSCVTGFTQPLVDNCAFL
jgi:hypothetical protein